MVRTLTAGILSALTGFGLVLSLPREFPLILERIEEVWRAMLQWLADSLPYDESRPVIWFTIRFLSYLRAEVGGKELLGILVIGFVLWLFFTVEDWMRAIFRKNS